MRFFVCSVADETPMNPLWKIVQVLGAILFWAAVLAVLAWFLEIVCVVSCY